jgi:nucleoid-associated protein YgaU
MRSATPYETYGVPNPDADAYLEQHTFRAGDTISGVAYQFYGDWRLWRSIAKKNSIADVRQIAPGTVLLIPQRELQSGRYEST